jgi:hypothetical protein
LQPSDSNCRFAPKIQKNIMRICYNCIQIKRVLFYLFLLVNVFFAKLVSGQQIYVPSSGASVSSGATYCPGTMLPLLVFTVNECNSGSGTPAGIGATVSWYRNTTNSTVGGTLVATRTKTLATAATDTVTYQPIAANGIYYYYCILSWSGAGTCNASGTLTSATMRITVPDRPVITSVSPLSAFTGATVSIRGAGFNTAAAGNYVYFGSVRATITAASDTLLTVAAPVGGSCAAITVQDTSGCGLMASAPQAFNPAYNNSPYATGLNVASPVTLSAGSQPRETATGDIDGDGKPDLIVANSASNTISVFRNIASSGAITAGSFAGAITFATGSQPTGVAIGDLDGDGKFDIAVTQSGANSIALFKNLSASGSISLAGRVDYSLASGPGGLDISDLDLDGKPDIVIATGTTVTLLKNYSARGVVNTSSFGVAGTLAAGSGTAFVRCADIDQDGKPEIIATSSVSNLFSIYKNNATPGTLSSGAFAAAVNFSTGTNPMGLVCGDFDGDGKIDLAIANYAVNNLSIYRNISSPGSITTGSLASVAIFTTGVAPQTIAIGDMDGDGKPDIITANSGGGTISIHRNTSTSGSINLSSYIDFSSGSQPWGIAICDLDADGKCDIVSAGNGAGSVAVLKNIPLLYIRSDNHNKGCLRTLYANVGGGTWSIAPSGIATINSSGVVAALNTGTAVVTYTLAGVSDTETITVLNGTPPMVTATVPATAYPGTTVTIKGLHFNDTAANNIIYFGATRGYCTAATDTTLTVPVPAGATCATISVTDSLNCLSSNDRKPFVPAFNNSSYLAGFNFSAQFTLATSASPRKTLISDVDGDGKSDILVLNSGSNALSVYRNISTSGTLNSSSFA